MESHHRQRAGPDRKAAEPRVAESTLSADPGLRAWRSGIGRSDEKGLRFLGGHLSRTRTLDTEPGEGPRRLHGARPFNGRVGVRGLRVDFLELLGHLQLTDVAQNVRLDSDDVRYRSVAG